MNKKGSFTVFALMLFMSVLIAVIAAINAACNVALQGTVNSLGKLWSESILGEYDLFLKDRYGIFGFYGYDHLIEEKLRFYSNYSFYDKKHIKVKEIKADVDSYSLINMPILKKQIEEAVIYMAKPKEYKIMTENTEVDGTRTENRYIKSLWVERGLPSYGKTEKIYLIELIEAIKDGINFDSITGDMVLDKYIFTFFKNKMNQKQLGDTYFNLETEYIISGQLSDSESEKDVKGKIKTMRNMLNLFYLYGCTEKRQAVLAMAQAITPGPAAVLTQAVMMETWAYMEAENDINILYSGKTVPLLKKDCNWALSLENVFGTSDSTEEQGNKEIGGGIEKKNDSYILPQVVEGDEYENYLRILLIGLTEETKLLRIADLIQINGKYLYCDSFLIKDYCLGLEYNMKVNDYEGTFKETY